MTSRVAVSVVRGRLVNMNLKKPIMGEPMIEEQHVFNGPMHCGFCQSAPCECPSHDESIPRETRLELMQCAVSNGRISYHYLCDLWKRGRRSGLARAESAEAALAQMREALETQCRLAFRAGMHSACDHPLKDEWIDQAWNNWQANNTLRAYAEAVLHGRDPETPT